MKETMTSRERMLKSLNHEIPDRIPIDLGGCQTGIHQKAYKKLLQYLDIKDEINILDPVQQLAQPCEQVLERFHVDTRYITAHAPDSFKGSIIKKMRNGRLWHDLKDEFGVIWSMPNDQQLYMDISFHPLADANITDIADYPFPNGGDPSRFSGVRDTTSQLRKNTPYAISTGIGGVVYEICWYMRGLEQWFRDMIENPTFCEALLDQTLKFWLDYYTGFMSQIGDLVDVVMIGDDLTGQYGPLFSPDFYLWYHTCGSCVEYIPDLIDNGINILNPIQISATHMDPHHLKKNYGANLVFWGGGCDSQNVLSSASPEEITRHVRKNVEIFKTGSGYVFNNVHNIQADVPPENIVAMYDAAYKFGQYK